MKKISVILVLTLTVLPACAGTSYLDEQLKDVRNNVNYQSVPIHEKSYADEKYFPVIDSGMIDPGLININADYTKVNEADYEKKLVKDEKEYAKFVPANRKKASAPESVDYYKMYRIAERLIRANNLDYVNWRIAIRKTEEDVNAASTSGNFIYINTALYDSLYPNEDALAFVLAHEMAHLILGHQQRMAEQAAQISNLSPYLTQNARRQAPVASFASQVRVNNIYGKLQMMEYMADAEAFILMTKAGYSPDSGLETLNFLAALPEIDTIFRTHPLSADRIESAVRNIEVLNPDWIEEGKANIYNSEVLSFKQSSDRVSFSIIKSGEKKNFYHTENPQQRLTRMAYILYMSNKPKTAAKYFHELTEVRSDYVPYLYESYANEAYYKKTNEQKYHKRAIKAAQKAAELKPADKNVEAQLEALGL